MMRLLFTLMACSAACLVNAQSDDNKFTQAKFTELCDSAGVVVLPPREYELQEPLELKACDLYAKDATFRVTFAASSEQPAIKISPSSTLPGVTRYQQPCRIRDENKNCLYNTSLRGRGKIVLPRMVNGGEAGATVAVQMIDVINYRIEVDQITGFDVGIEMIANDQVANNDFFFANSSPVSNMKNNTNFRGVYNKKELDGKTFYAWINQLNFHGGIFETNSNTGAQLTFDNSIRRYANAYTWFSSNFKNGTIKLEGDNFAFHDTTFSEDVTFIANNYLCKNGENCVDRDGVLDDYISKDNVINIASGSAMPKCQQEYLSSDSSVAYTQPETCSTEKHMPHMRVEKETVESIRDGLTR
ncbi:hypothetical protein SG34_023795 [Thalassomonas viridans]|uniref:Right handed beta helix domain-containing protein n=1 Tax=Thalassomonas viridans TaxID=137584 RepID=A0AAF0C841_9GAMM|nr:hypothetical protein [Thalassomonas viridans]WDE04333.1 hypothetical protein SG34_023795 [Thalassomonas viridans]